MRLELIKHNPDFLQESRSIRHKMEENEIKFPKLRFLEHTPYRENMMWLK